jgi:autotransporter adhesin
MAITRTSPARRGAAVAALAATALLAGCSASVTVNDGKPKLSADKLATTVSKKLAETTGQPEPDITCPEDLTGETGTTTRCTLTAGDGSTLGVTVKVTSVKDGKINFDIKADDTASPAPN